MTTFSCTIAILVIAVLVSRGRAKNFLWMGYKLIWQVFRLPTQLELSVYKKCEIRANEGFKICPHCEKSRIRINDSICSNCKLEISLGQDISSIHKRKKHPFKHY